MWVFVVPMARQQAENLIMKSFLARLHMSAQMNFTLAANDAYTNS